MPPRSTLITGAQGQLGSLLVNRLRQRQHTRVTAIDRAELDLTDGPTLRRFLEQLRPQVVINCAAYTAVDQAEKEPARCRSVNVEAVRTLAEATREIGAHLVQISTDYVFGHATPHRRPWQETDRPTPQGVYATSKLEAELAAAVNPAHTIVRTCGLYRAPSAGRVFSNFVSTMWQLAAQRPSLPVVDDQWCTPSCAEQVAAGILHLVDAGETGLFHVANRGATTWARFAEAIFALRGLPCRVERITTETYRQDHPDTALRPTYSVLSTAKYLGTGGPPLDHWRDALAKTLRQWP